MIRRKRSETASAERKQLEAIAHLYFPARGASVREPGDPPPEHRCVSPQGDPQHAPFLVCLAASQDGSVPAVGCLYNLGVLLRVSDGPVLLLGSEVAVRERFSFRFRPDRERFFSCQGIPAAGSICGPMDIRLASAGNRQPGDAGWRDGVLGGDTGPGGMYRYLLTDDLPSVAHFQDVPGMVLFVVTPRTDPDAFLGRGTGPLREVCVRADHAGVVTAGVGDEHEELFRRWEAVLSSRLPATVRVEHAGRLSGPLSSHRGEIGVGIGMRVLEAPGSLEARCLMELAAGIRKRRAARLQGSFGTCGKDPIRDLLDRGVFDSVGLSVFREGLPGEDGSEAGPLLVKNPGDRVMIPEWVAHGKDVNLDRLLSRYLRVYENLNRDEGRGTGGPARRVSMAAELPGIVLVLEEKRDARRMEHVLKLVSRMPVEIYALCRTPTEAEGERVELEAQELEPGGAFDVLGCAEHPVPAL